MTANTDPNAIDYVTSAAKAVLGMVPFAGSLLAELAGTVIPNQRVDRLSKFSIQLESKLTGIDQDLIRAKLKDENFTDLLESTARQAAQAITEERRAYLASLIANGIDGERLTFVESKQILRLLGEINDIEVVWLRFYLHPYFGGDTDFREKHKAVIEPISATLGSDQATLDKHSLQANYLQHLVSLGLLERPYQIDSKSGYPVFDKMKNDWKTKGHQLTPLGRLVLRQIGFSLESAKEE